MATGEHFASGSRRPYAAKGDEGLSSLRFLGGDGGYPELTHKELSELWLVTVMALYQL